MKSLLGIENFGAVDADNDSILYDCFEDHEAYLNLLNFKRFLIIGKKGSGKTAMFKKLLEMKAADSFSLGHTFADYPWHYHDKQARIGIPDYDKYTHSWKYLILLTASKIILNQDNSLPYSDASMESMVKIERFIIDTYGTRDPDVTQIFTPTKNLKLKPTFELNFSVLKAGISPESVPMEELPTIVQEVNSNLLQCVTSCLNEENKYYIAFDQLDLGFNPNDKEYYNRLIGLILACRDINIKAREAGKQLFVCVFLRDDIYEDLHFEDKNKITENFESLIEWDTQRTTRTLKGLMEKRFQKLLSENNSVADKVGWNDVFDEKKEMRGHQTKYQHILDRTYLRPRDVIKFSNAILSQYKERVSKASSDATTKFDNLDVNAAKDEYGNYFLKELDDEIHKHVPAYKEYFEIFKKIGVNQFDLEEFSKNMPTGQSGNSKKISEILKSLFEFSVIGYYRAGGRGYGGSEYVFRYKDPRSQFDESAKKFKIHPGFTDVLGVKKFTRTSDIEENSEE